MTMLGALIGFSLASAVWSFPNGAPAGACDSMAPNTAAKPSGHGAPPQTRPSEFVVTIGVGANGWMPNTEYTINITKKNSSSDDIEGFLCQVRSSASDITQHGSFVNLPNIYKNAPCKTAWNGSVTHTVALYNASASMTWRSPAVSLPRPGSLMAFCTIVQHTPTYWVKVPSNIFQLSASAPSPPPPAKPTPKSTPGKGTSGKPGYPNQTAAPPTAGKGSTSPASDATKVTAGIAIVLALSLLHKAFI